MTLDLNEGSAKKDAFFAIFDGHGGVYLSMPYAP